MANDDGNGKYPTWKWLSGVLISLVLIISGYALGGTLTDMKTDLKAKLDKAEYYRDIRDIQKDIRIIKNWHLPPNLREPVDK
jgi:hypothetical protein